MTKPRFALALHGGAGTLKPEHFSSAQEAAARAALSAALAIGHDLLAAGCDALTAVCQVVESLENAPMFNAGIGAVYTERGDHELDAGIMRGRDLAAGSVCGVKHIAHPIALAKAVLLDGRHVLLSGEGAEAFAQTQHIPLVDNHYFDTEARHKQWRVSQALSEFGHLEAADKKFGTVGAVACDLTGSVAAATSTGGMTNKRFGRVGDSPLVGAGVYADDRSCAVSSTGHGEFFIRSCAAYDVAARMRYLGEPLADAAHHVVHHSLLPMGGIGGLIAVDAECNLALPFNSLGMYRAHVRESEEAVVAIYV